MALQNTGRLPSESNRTLRAEVHQDHRPWRTRRGPLRHSTSAQEGTMAAIWMDRDPRRATQAAPSRRNEYSRRGSTTNPQAQYSSSHPTPQDEYLPPRSQPAGRSYPGIPSESQTSLQRHQQSRPVYPPGFGSEEEEALPSRKSMQQNRPARGPTVLTKDRRRFADAYEQDQENGAGGGGHHAGTSGAAKRVMDFLRRRGKARTGDDRM